MDTIINLLKENIGSIIGALIPVAGSVYLIHYSKNADEKECYHIYFGRFCELIKYNLVIASTRIVDRTNMIEFTSDEINKVLSDIESIGYRRSRKLYNDFFELAFSMSKGQQLSMSYTEFYKIVFNQTKKNNCSFIELKKIIDSVGLDNVYEFKIIRLLILLARKLEITTSFDGYYRLVKQIDGTVSVEKAIRYYIIEHIHDSYFGVSNKIYFLNEYLSDRKANKVEDNVLSMPSLVSHQNVKFHEALTEKFKYYQGIIDDFSQEKIWYRYLEGMTSDSITLESMHIKAVRQELVTMYSSDSHIYLTFLGISENGDALDNNGRSRQNEFLEGRRSEPYQMLQRSWYHDAIAEGPNCVTITYPYVDTSKSYVISFVKKLYIEETIKGVIGLDIVIDDLLGDIISNHPYKVIIFTSEGEIIFDTTDQGNRFSLLSNNIFLRMGVDIFRSMQKNENAILKLERKTVFFSTLVKNKYYYIMYKRR